MPLFTLGYEGLDLDTFVQILLDNGVKCLLDVRQRPQSRKRGFSKTALANACAENGVGYRHLAVFGCPLSIRNAYREDGDWGKLYRRFSGTFRFVGVKTSRRKLSDDNVG